MAEPSVRMSGIVLASLMFQHFNSDSDVEGLILGESKFEEQVTINDSQSDHIQIEEIYNIQQHLPCHRLNNFYNSVGDVKLDDVKKVLADNKQESVIGWYRQRRNSDQQMSFREKLVHEKLKSALANPNMIFVLLTPSKVTSPGSTHRMEYAAFISQASRLYLKIPVLINNLGLLEQLTYWKVSSSCSAAGYNLTMKKHSSCFFSSNGLPREVDEVNKMNDSLQLELEKACHNVEESEHLVETLQADVLALKRQLNEKRQNESASDKNPPEQKNNLMLHKALRTLFGSTPLFQTQTLNCEAHPISEPCCCCVENNVEESATEQDTVEDPESLSLLFSCRTKPQKRLRGTNLVRQRKRRKSCS